MAKCQNCSSEDVEILVFALGKLTKCNHCHEETFTARGQHNRPDFFVDDVIDRSMDGQDADVFELTYSSSVY